MLAALVPAISEDLNRAGRGTSTLIRIAFGKTVQFFSKVLAHGRASPRVRERQREKLRHKPCCLFHAISEETSHYFYCILLVTQTSSGTVYKDVTSGRQGSLRPSWILSQPILIPSQGPHKSHPITAVIPIPESHHLSLVWVQIRFPRCHSLSTVPYDLKVFKETSYLYLALCGRYTAVGGLDNHCIYSRSKGKEMGGIKGSVIHRNSEIQLIKCQKFFVCLFCLFLFFTKIWSYPRPAVFLLHGPRLLPLRRSFHYHERASSL